MKNLNFLAVVLGLLFTNIGFAQTRGTSLPLIVSASSNRTIVVTTSQDGKRFWLAECSLASDDTQTRFAILTQLNTSPQCEIFDSKSFSRSSELAIYRIDSAFAFYLQNTIHDLHDQMQRNGAISGLVWLSSLVYSSFNKNIFIRLIGLSFGVGFVGFQGLAVEQSIRSKAALDIPPPLRTAFAQKIDDPMVFREPKTWDRWVIPGLYPMYKKAIVEAFRVASLDPVLQ